MTKFIKKVLKMCINIKKKNKWHCLIKTIAYSIRILYYKKDNKILQKLCL